MITKFTVAGLKAFGDDVSFELAPLTLVVGENGAGKTSFFEAIALLAQSASSYHRTGFQWRAEHREGARSVGWVDLPAPPRCLHGRSSDVQLHLGIEIEEGRYTRGQRLGYDVWHRQATEQWAEWRHKLTCGNDTIERIHELEAHADDSARYRRLLKVNGKVAQKDDSGNEDHILDRQVFWVPTNVPSAEPYRRQLDGAREWVDTLSSFLRERFSYVGPERGPSSMDREISGTVEVPRTVGKHGQDTLRLLAHVFSSDEYRDSAEPIRKWAEQFGLGKLSAGWGGGSQLSCDFRDSQTGTVISFDLSGYGSAQLLPVIVESFAAGPGATVLIEEPEISLHPRAVADLPLMFGEAVARGNQIVVSTHSEVLLGELHRAVSNKIMSADDIAVIHLERGEAGSTAHRLPVSAAGLISGWVPSFTNAEDDSANRLFTVVGEPAASADGADK